jgi:hypothetical protein
MTGFLRTLTTAVAVASIPAATVAVATATADPAKCDQTETAHCVSSKPHCDPNFSRNVWTGECHPQPAAPDWYVVRPPYAPPYAPVDVPPPPPPPPWAQHMQPRWDEGSQRWFWAGV